MKRLSAARKGIPYCYILQCADGTYYTGWTNDLPRRFREHSAGRGCRYTRSRCPLTLAYFERQKDAGVARRREIEIKRLPRARKAELAAGKTPVKRMCSKRSQGKIIPPLGRTKKGI